jgi:phytoene dehydrogenase-like protein
MSNTNYDVIVIGGGVHGLATAAIAASKKKRVLLLESATEVGGMHRATSVGSHKSDGLFPVLDQIDPALIRELQLEKHGLKMINAPLTQMIYPSQGEALEISTDLETTAGKLRNKFPKDADGLLKINSFIARIRDLFLGLVNGPQTNIIDMSASNLWELLPKALGLRMLGKKDMFDVICALPMCLADFLGEHLTLNPLKGGLATSALSGTYLAPWSPGSTTNFLLQHIASRSRVVGGGAALVSALKSAAEANGVTVRTGCDVKQVNVTKQSATGVTLANGESFNATKVVSTVDSTQTLAKMLPPLALTTKSTQRLKSFRSRGTVGIAQFVLSADANLKQTSNPSEEAMFVTSDHVDQLEKAFDPIKYKEVTDQPALWGSISASSRTGGRLLTVHASYLPYELQGGWTEETKAKVFASIESQLTRVIDGFSSKVQGKAFFTPKDVETTFQATGGHLHHGEIALDQLFLRPIPECSRYETPIANLFLAGKGMQLLSTNIGAPAVQVSKLL